MTAANVNEKLIKPLVPGLALVYPLAGLPVCAECGRALQISSSGKYKMKSGEERRYASAYFCPGGQAGACSNRRRIPEPWLWAEVLKRLNAKLLGFDFGEEVA
jgi:hypothetical protein